MAAACTHAAWPTCHPDDPHLGVDDRLGDVVPDPRAAVGVRLLVAAQLALAEQAVRVGAVAVEVVGRLRLLAPLARLRQHAPREHGNGDRWQPSDQTRTALCFASCGHGIVAETLFARSAVLSRCVGKGTSVLHPAALCTVSIA